MGGTVIWWWVALVVLILSVTLLPLLCGMYASNKEWKRVHRDQVR